MRVINKLTNPGVIKQVVLNHEKVIVTLLDKQSIIYRRVDGDTEKAQ